MSVYDDEPAFKMQKITEMDKLRMLSHVGLCLLRKQPGMEVYLTVDEMMTSLNNPDAKTFVTEPFMDGVKFYLV